MSKLRPYNQLTTLAAAFSIFGLFTARAEIELIGILATSQSTRFALTDTTTGKTDWVGRGDGFAGYTVASHDSKNDTLLLLREGTELRLRLKDDSKIKSARLELTCSITFGAGEKIEIERATLLYDQENIFPLKDGVTYRISPARRPDGTIRYNITVERILSENKTEKLSAAGVIAGPGQRFSIRFPDDLAFTFTPR
jgi:hypothetical protein